MSFIVYGIKNCNTVKSALAWLKDNEVAFEFHDFKAKGITDTQLTSWSKQVGWESLVNKRGTTWRQLSPDVQRGVTGQAAAVSLMREKPSVIKRPVIEKDNRIVTLGFDPEEFSKRYKK